jgi:hypothetical protein
VFVLGFGMLKETPRVIDAEFTVIREPRRWSISFDWRVFAVIALGSLAGFIARVLDVLR